jgi:hypothetical protein
VGAEVGPVHGAQHGVVVGLDQTSDGLVARARGVTGQGVREPGSQAATLLAVLDQQADVEAFATGSGHAGGDDG